MEKYIVKSGVKLEMNGTELVIVDMETGFVGTGNQCSFDILSLLSTPKTAAEVVESLKEMYNENQHSRIEKSIPNVIKWALERNIVIVADEA